jgi:PTS system lactose-specific IIC component
LQRLSPLSYRRFLPPQTVILGFVFLINKSTITMAKTEKANGKTSLNVCEMVPGTSLGVYRFCVLKNITIKMPKEVPGTISQTFKDVFPFACLRR